jgi:hypothetical protein
MSWVAWFVIGFLWLFSMRNQIRKHSRGGWVYLTATIVINVVAWPLCMLIYAYARSQGRDTLL